ncbi:MAG: hypothetical protein IPH36_01690 [Saprospiraceae bacterium]|nr:hypothetical protein [Saprospiraceae bacterium]
MWGAFFMVTFFNLSEIKATHIVGGDITYRFLDRLDGQNRYQIVLTIRRDCSKDLNGIELNEDFDKNAFISIFKR